MEAAKGLEIAVAAAVTVSGTSLDEVERQLAAGVGDYLKTLIGSKYGKIYYGPDGDLPYSLVYNRVLAILLTIPGVENFSALTVNGGTADVSIQADTIPVLGEVTVT